MVSITIRIKPNPKFGSDCYRFATDGSVHNIKDPETDLIDEDELDQVADDLGATFTELLENLE